MRVRHFPTVDSVMARYWRPTDVFELCDDFGNVLVTWTGQQLMERLAADLVQAASVATLVDSLRHTPRNLYPRRRLLGQHKPLRVLPASPHDATPQRPEPSA